jgi:hypothetical protein
MVHLSEAVGRLEQAALRALAAETARTEELVQVRAECTSLRRAQENVADTLEATIGRLRRLLGAGPAHTGQASDAGGVNGGGSSPD